MSERGGKRERERGFGAAAPFYAPPRRKTSAEIISEARAAVYGEMSGASSGAGSVTGAGGALRPLRTRRPFTPREPQRTLFAERARKKDSRPPSAFDLKSLSLQEANEEKPSVLWLKTTSAEEYVNGVLVEPPNNTKKKPALHKQARSTQERSGDGWAGLPKLPHLSGRSKPLHRRNTHTEDSTSNDLANAISVTKPFGNFGNGSVTNLSSKSPSPEPTAARRRQFGASKSVSCETNVFKDIAVKHLAVQLPNTSGGEYDSMSLLELAESLSRRNPDVEETICMLEAMQKLLESSQPANNLRELVLRALYVHIDSDDERVLVTIAKALLQMRVTGNHLAAACKLVFKIARNDNNDHFFRNSNLLDLLIEGCGRADPLTEGECCVYGAGALRFLALDPRLCALAHRAGALHLAALHLKILNNAKAENPRAVSDHSIHALYQLTGALRNLAGAGQREAKDFVASGALGELLNALVNHTDRDVLTNVARCLSVLSAEESCCAWLCSSSVAASALVRALAACAARAPLAVRLAYTLGNMAAADDQARINIYDEEGGVDVLLTILESYTSRHNSDARVEEDPDFHLVVSDLGGSDGSNEDVLIKTVRVVANLCLAERAGRGLADMHAERTTRALLACLKVADKLAIKPAKQRKESEESSSWQERREELATAALATLNNITYYRDPPDPPDPLPHILHTVAKVTCLWLAGSGSAACEAVRALGNLSRSPHVAQLLVLEGVVHKLEPFLQHEDVSVRCAAAGVLVNVCGAGVDGAEVAELAAGALSAAAAAGDAPLATLLARALWNAHAHAPLSAVHAHQAATALTMFIDDETVFAPCQATRSDRRNSEPGLSKRIRVKFDVDNNNYEEDHPKPFTKAYSVDQNLHLSDLSGDDEGDFPCSGEDLGFEDGDPVDEECDCDPCRRLAAWEELLGVAIPLLEQLRPNRTDASVGTD